MVAAESPQSRGGSSQNLLRDVFSIRSVLWNAGWAITSIIAGRIIRATDSYASVFVIYCVFLVLSVGLFQIYFQRRVAERARDAAIVAQPSRA